MRSPWPAALVVGGGGGDVVVEALGQLIFF